MKTQEHTPGPWTVYSWSSFPNRYEIWDKDGNLFPDVPDIDDQRVANARLIAAAPQLLKALEHVTEWLDNGSCLDRTVVRAAIRSAKGETL